MNEFSRLSFLATIAFGIATLLALAAAAFMLGDALVMFCAIMALACAYVAQFLYTYSFDEAQSSARARLLYQAGVAFQLLAVLAFSLGAWRVLGSA